MTHAQWTQDKAQLELLEQRVRAIGVSRRRFVQVVAAAGGAAAVATAAGTSEAQAQYLIDAARRSDSAVKRQRPQVFRTGNLTADPDSHDFNADLYCNGIPYLFAGLTVFDHEFNALPYVADSWETNPDGSVWTFKIRRDAKWTNGDPVTAGDFVYSFIRQLEPDTAAPYSSFFYDIKGAEPFNKASPKNVSEADRNALREQIGLRALDSNTLQVTLEGPRGYVAILMAYAAALPAHRASVDRHGKKWTEAGNIVGNGPFKLTVWERNKRLEIVRNDDFFAQKPRLDRVEYPITPLPAGIAPYENDEVDLRIVRPTEWPRVQSDAKLSKEYIKHSYAGTWYIVPEVKHPPFDDIRVRRAMMHAIDREEICDAVLRGLGLPAYTFNPPDTPGYIDPNTNPEFRERAKFDPKLAIEQLKGTPYEGGRNWPRLTMRLREGDPGAQETSEAVQAMLKENLGMDVQLEILERRIFRDLMWQHQNQITYVRWYQDYPDPHNEYYSVFYSKGTVARHNWSNDRFNELVQQAAAELKWENRFRMYMEAERLMQEQAAIVNVYYPLGAQLVKPYVKGMPVNKAGLHVPDWNIYVDMLRQLYIDG